MPFMKIVEAALHVHEILYERERQITGLQQKIAELEHSTKPRPPSLNDFKWKGRPILEVMHELLYVLEINKAKLENGTGVYALPEYQECAEMVGHCMNKRFDPPTDAVQTEAEADHEGREEDLCDYCGHTRASHWKDGRCFVVAKYYCHPYTVPIEGASGVFGCACTKFVEADKNV